MEPIADNEIKRVLVVNAHPDDSDFGASGTIAHWVKKGIEVAYVFCTNGDQGGEESGFTKEEMPAIRQREQRAAGAAIGVTDITFLNYVDGHLVPTIELRKDIVRQIRISKPDRIVCRVQNAIGTESEQAILIIWLQGKQQFKRFIQTLVILLHSRTY